MHHLKMITLFTALLFCFVVMATARAGSTSPLNDVWNSGIRLLFHTDNVTLSGEATFFLDGKQFKKAQLNYIQDGASSFYDLVLLTPIAEGTEQKTGWTITADANGNLNVMERYTPGIYRTGTCAANNTLLRRSVQLDALTDLGGFLVGQVESLLPEGTVTITEKDGIKSVHIAVSKNQIPEMAVSALNLASSYLSSRWFSLGYDQGIAQDEGIPFENYISVTQALTNGTVRWALEEADIDFSIDSQGSLSMTKGEIRVASVFWDQTTRDVTVSFNLSASNYGNSHVKAFDPSDYNVVLPEDLPETALPAYAYPGNDPIEAAIAAYMAEIGRQRYLTKEGAVSIPAPVILKIEEPDETHRIVYGNFWVFSYVLKDGILQCISGGEQTGIMTLEKTEEGWKAVALEEAGDGDYYEKDIHRFSHGDAELEAKYLSTPYEDIRLRFIQDYAAANGLAVKAYQDYGWEPVPLPANKSPKIVTALASEINPEKLALSAVNARITAYLPDENSLMVELIVPERYDRDEVLNLDVGDVICTQGKEITVQSISQDESGYLVINKGDYEFSEDSVWLYESMDGSYQIADWHDNTWTVLAKRNVPVEDTLMFLDGIDPSSGETLPMPTVHSSKEFITMLEKESAGDGPGFASNNVYVAFNESGQLALIYRFYVSWQ